MWWKKSLRRRLTFAIGLPVMAALLAMGSIGYVSAHREIEEIYDAQLSHIAKVLFQVPFLIINHAHHDLLPA